jgi:hypothetical protein
MAMERRMERARRDCRFAMAGLRLEMLGGRRRDRKDRRDHRELQFSIPFCALGDLCDLGDLGDLISTIFAISAVFLHRYRA